MAGIMAFKIPHLDSHNGGKIFLYIFNDDTYEELEEKADQAKDITDFFEKEIQPLAHCLFQTIDVDSEWSLSKAKIGKTQTSIKTTYS